MAYQKPELLEYKPLNGLEIHRIEGSRKRVLRLGDLLRQSFDLESDDTIPEVVKFMRRGTIARVAT